MMPVTHPSQHAVHSPHSRAAGAAMLITAPQHFLYFLPLPQGHGSLRPTGMCNQIVWEASSILAGYARLSRGLVVVVARCEHARRENARVALRPLPRRNSLPGGPPRPALRGL